MISLVSSHMLFLMEPTTLLAAGVALLAGALVLLATAAQALARLARSMHGPRFLRRPVVAVAVVASLLRAVPAAGTMPPPILRLDPPGVVPATVDAITASLASAPGTHTVRPGDTLWAIGKSELQSRGEPVSEPAIARMWRAIYEANVDVVGPDPNLILPGQRLVMPGDV